MANNRIKALVVALLVAGGPVAAENVALVVSNGGYVFGADEPAINGAHRQLVETYQQRGYRVVEGENLGRVALARKLTEFQTALGAGDTAVVQLNGHMGSYGAVGWFLPSDVNANSATDTAFGALSLDVVAQMLAPYQGQAVLFLGQSGQVPRAIAGVEPGIGIPTVPPGVVMISGAVSDINSAVTRDFLRPGARLLDGITRAGARLQVDGYLPAGLILAPRNAPPVVITRPQPPAVVNTPERIEAALNLSRDARRAIQADLTILGFNTRGVDGIFGNGTRTAIRNWQRDQGFTQTGFVTRPQILRLSRQANIARRDEQAADDSYWQQTGASGREEDLNSYLNRYPNGIHAETARRDLQDLRAAADQDAWDAARAADTLRAYRRYLRAYPDGLYNRAAKARIEAMGGRLDDDSDDENPDQPDAGRIAAEAAENALNLDMGTRLLIELRLVALGYAVGPTDGVFDRTTRAALAAFQSDRNMPATGYVTALTVTALLRRN